VGTMPPTASQTELAEAMVGRTVKLVVDKPPANPGERTFKVEHLSLVEPNGVVALDDVSFEVAKGEILAIAGVQGNGQTQLTQTLLGLRPATSGSITLGGYELAGRRVKQVLDHGVGFVPEDRSRDGIVESFSIAENLVLDTFDRPPFGSKVALNVSEIEKNAKDLVGQYDIRIGSERDPISTLSGGNQQKVVIARELSRNLSVLIASQPTRGVDVGSIEFIHNQIVAERDKGTPIIVVSTELDEVLALADRIAVMYDGKIVGIVPPDTSRNTLGLMMAGASDGSPDPEEVTA